jgi:hypothetical protein
MPRSASVAQVTPKPYNQYKRVRGSPQAGVCEKSHENCAVSHGIDRRARIEFKHSVRIQTYYPSGSWHRVYRRGCKQEVAGVVTRTVAMVLLMVLLLGCDSGKPTYPSARLEGSVTLDGKPIAQGSLQFMPQDVGQVPSTAAPIVDGKYVADAVPRGKLRVLLSATKETGKIIKEYSSSRPEVVNLIPEKYRAGIPINVTGDNPNQDFPLKSR